MTVHDTDKDPDPSAGGGGVAVRLLSISFAIVVLGIVISLVLPGIPEGARDTAALGCGVAGAVGLVMAAVKARMLRGGPSGIAGQDAVKLQAALLGDFLVQLIVLGIGIAVFRSQGTKFIGIAGFGGAYAGIVLAQGVAQAAVLSRVLATPASVLANLPPLVEDPDETPSETSESDSSSAPSSSNRDDVSAQSAASPTGARQNDTGQS